jgi:hypothetical protein
MVPVYGTLLGLEKIISNNVAFASKVTNHITKTKDFQQIFQVTISSIQCIKESKPTLYQQIFKHQILTIQINQFYKTKVVQWLIDYKCINLYGI